MNKSTSSPHFLLAWAMIAIITPLCTNAATRTDKSTSSSIVLVSPDFPLSPAQLRARGFLPPEVVNPGNGTKQASDFIVGNFHYHVVSRYTTSNGWEFESLRAVHVNNKNAPSVGAPIPRSQLFPNAETGTWAGIDKQLRSGTPDGEPSPPPPPSPMDYPPPSNPGYPGQQIHQSITGVENGWYNVSYTYTYYASGGYWYMSSWSTTKCGVQFQCVIQ